MHADEFAPADQSGSAVLSSNYYLTSDDTWEDTGLSMVLPGAGKYELHADVRGAIRAAFSTSSAYMVAKFYNFTAGVEIADSVDVDRSNRRIRCAIPDDAAYVSAGYRRRFDNHQPVRLASKSAPDVVWSRSLIGSNYPAGQKSR